MMDIKNNCMSKILMILGFTALTSPFISFKNRLAKFGIVRGISYATLIALPIAMLFSLNPRISFESFVPRNHTFFEMKRFEVFTGNWFGNSRDIETGMSLLVSHSFNTGVIAFFKTLIPSRECSKASSCFKDSYMMSPSETLFNYLTTSAKTFIFHNCILYRETISVNRKLGETGKLSKETIPYQAEWGIGHSEGLTTTRVSPNNNLSQERPTSSKDEEIVWTSKRLEDATFKRCSDNKSNGVSYTQKIDTLSEFNMRNTHEAGLVEDQVSTIDAAICAYFKKGRFTAVCSVTNTTIFTTNSAATIVATCSPSDKNIRDIVDYMKQKQIPKIGGGYVGILSVTAMRGVYDYIQAIAQYAEPQFRFNDEVGRYYTCRFVEDNSQLSNTIGNSSLYGEGLMFGAEAVAEVVAMPEELRYEETDLGRSKKLGWLAILGWEKIWDLSNDDSNSTGKGIERIVRITSA